MHSHVPKKYTWDYLRNRLALTILTYPTQSGRVCYGSCQLKNFNWWDLGAEPCLLLSPPFGTSYLQRRGRPPLFRPSRIMSRPGSANWHENLRLICNSGDCWWLETAPPTSLTFIVLIFNFVLNSAFSFVFNCVFYITVYFLLQLPEVTQVRWEV